LASLKYSQKCQFSHFTILSDIISVKNQKFHQKSKKISKMIFFSKIENCLIGIIPKLQKKIKKKRFRRHNAFFLFQTTKRAPLSYVMAAKSFFLTFSKNIKISIFYPKWSQNWKIFVIFFEGQIFSISLIVLKSSTKK